MKHIKLFENFLNESNSFYSYKYATCLQTDAIIAIGVLNQQDREKIQDSFNQHLYFQNINNEIYGREDDFLRLVDIDISRASYILYTQKKGNSKENEFIALPPDTDPYDYEMFVDENGITHFNDELFQKNIEKQGYASGVFGLARDKMIVHDLWRPEIDSDKDVFHVSQFINKYFRKDPRSDSQIYSDSMKSSIGALEREKSRNMRAIEQSKQVLKDNEDQYRKRSIDRNHYEHIKKSTENRMAIYQKHLERVLPKYN